MMPGDRLANAACHEVSAFSKLLERAEGGLESS